MLSTKSLFIAALGVSGFFLTPIPRAASSSHASKLILTSRMNGLEAMPEFTCSDTIHGYVTLPEKAVGAHTIEGIWIMPNGVEKEHSKDRVEFPESGRQTAYVWLRFLDKTGGALAGLRPGGEAEPDDPSDGQWRVQVLWDGEPLIESKFKVKCS